MPETQEGRERLVKLEVQLEGLREQQKAHAWETRKAIQELSRKVDELTAIMNKGKGAFTFAIIAAGMVGGIATKIASSLINKIGN